MLHRRSYFTTNSVHRKTEFMQIINSSCTESGFTCSFTDKELAEFIQFKKRKDSGIPTKRVVACVGLQPGGNVWVLGKDVYVSALTGNLMTADECDFQWIGHLFRGPSVATNSTALPIQLPLTTEHILPLVDAMKKIMKHNFPQALLALGASCMLFHYGTILKENLCCPVPLLCGGVGTGKSLALRCALSLYGAHTQAFFARGTKEKYLLHLANSSIPIGIDDPQSNKSLGELIVEIYSGGKSTTVSHGVVQPTTSAVITANFNLAEESK